MTGQTISGQTETSQISFGPVGEIETTTAERSSLAHLHTSPALQYGALILGLSMIFLVVVLRCVYPFIKKYQSIDNPRFTSLFQFVHRIFDLVTDILVCYSIYLRNDMSYFYASVLFVILPLIVAIMAISYHLIFKWNEKHNAYLSIEYPAPERITNYLQKYKILLFIFTIISFDVYSSINLAQCRIFCLESLNLQLKPSEKHSFISWKFINQTLCENIPQIIIQVLYVSNTDIDDNINNGIFLIGISLILSIMSIISQTVIFLVQMNNILVKYNSHVTLITDFETKITLHSPYFQDKHQFIHDKIEQSLKNTCLKTNEIHDLMTRSDVSLNHYVYYITKHFQSKYKLVVYFTTRLTCYNDRSNTIHDTILSYLGELNNNSSIFQQNFLHGIRTLTGCKKIKCSNEFEIFKEEAINPMLKGDIWRKITNWHQGIANRHQQVIGNDNSGFNVHGQGNGNYNGNGYNHDQQSYGYGLGFQKGFKRHHSSINELHLAKVLEIELEKQPQVRLSLATDDDPNLKENQYSESSIKINGDGHTITDINTARGVHPLVGEKSSEHISMHGHRYGNGNRSVSVGVLDDIIILNQKSNDSHSLQIEGKHKATI